MPKKRQMAAGAFKAECLAVLDRVAETGETVVVTKRGRPVAEVVPIRGRATGSLRASVKTHGDIVGPALGEWDLDRWRSSTRTRKSGGSANWRD